MCKELCVVVLVNDSFCGGLQCFKKVIWTLIDIRFSEMNGVLDKSLRL